MSGIRRVVTGLRDGKSVYVSDDVVEPISPPLLYGNLIHEIWGADSTPSVPTDGSEPPRPHGYFAPAGGYRFGFFSIPPQSFVKPEVDDVEAATAETERLMPGLTTLPHPYGMHVTETVDLEFVVEGQIWLELDSGEEKVIRAGECIIQNGTVHVWHNRHETDWAKILLVFIGATKAE